MILRYFFCFIKNMGESCYEWQYFNILIKMISNYITALLVFTKSVISCPIQSVVCSVSVGWLLASRPMAGMVDQLWIVSRAFTCANSVSTRAKSSSFHSIHTPPWVGFPSFRVSLVTFLSDYLRFWWFFILTRNEIIVGIQLNIKNLVAVRK